MRENRRVKLYNAFITPILLYNCSTWEVPSNVIKRLEAFHRRQLRTVVGINYPQVIKNSELYKRTNSQLLGQTIVRARWRLFGHVLRLDDDVPARVMMVAYFENPSSAATWRGRPRATLPLSLHQDLQRIGGHSRNARNLRTSMPSPSRVQRIMPALYSALYDYPSIRALWSIRKEQNEHYVRFERHNEFHGG